ncbi:serine/threonine protein kinase [Gracilinema caldarium]|uniref:serine/threonine protein kinase n=1 Tax=Gracilinema caldarium TaxID=215591 RepID=UPI0026F0B5FD|nr:serine/threonine protein kinase [Gracilinema caldarium]
MEAPFNCLTPDLITDTVEEAFGISLKSVIYPYPSYINRVYGLEDTDGRELVAKFYRPGRWFIEQIQEEHQFLEELARGECPVVLPLPDRDGITIQTLTLEACTPGTTEATELVFYFALFPKISGRPFDPESDEDWLRLGSLAARLHVTGRKAKAESRLRLEPDLLQNYREKLLEEGLIPEDFVSDFISITDRALELFRSHYQGLSALRLHGDFHRGNLIGSSDRGLVIIDFDDMITGPAVQDLWLLLPDHLRNSRRELELILQGYTDFEEFDPRELALIEDLRFFRMVHYLHWQSQQRFDRAFYQHFPDWGSRAFWVKCIEDLEDQLCEMGG